MGKRLAALPALGLALVLAVAGLRPHSASIAHACLWLLLAPAIFGVLPWPGAGRMRPAELKLGRAFRIQRIE